MAVKIGHLVAQVQARLGSASNFTILAVIHGLGVYKQSRFGNPKGQGKSMARALKRACDSFKWPKDYHDWVRRDHDEEVHWQNFVRPWQGSNQAALRPSRHCSESDAIHSLTRPMAMPLLPHSISYELVWVPYRRRIW
jgi:hypothetical protein